jgi:hypothetical protein
LSCWRRVLQFADCLSQPSRGGKRQNLTTQVSVQIDRVASGHTVQTTTDPESSTQPSRGRGKVDKGIGADSAVRRASAKLQEGDIRGAVRCLCSEETLAPPTDATQQTLLAKHPSCPSDRRPAPSTTALPMLVSADEVKRAIRSFAPGSAGGRDGLRPQHLKNMVDDHAGVSLCDSLAEFCNLVLAGGVPEDVRPAFFGASLFPFAKKDGGIRPIAVGLTLRRLVAKVANSRALQSCTSLLAPTQLGVGAKGGAEALTHAARRYLQSMGGDRAFVKLDFSNAFNSVRRDSVMEAVATHRPDLLAFTESAYGSPSQLWVGDFCISSAEGVQQGDPLGPLLFCLALDGPLKEVQSEFISGYLDDIGLGDTVTRLITQVQKLEHSCLSIGLRLNHAKCEVFGLTSTSQSEWDKSGLKFIARPVEEASLLGAPLHIKGVDAALSSKCDQLQDVTQKLLKLSAHESFFLLKSCFAIPRLQYLLRTAPCSASPMTEHLDGVIRGVVSSLANVKFNEESWAQASLPVRWGGVGVRSTTVLAPSAFLASMNSANNMVDRLLPERARLCPDETVDVAVASWQNLGGDVPPTGQDCHSQRTWDDRLCSAISSKLLAQADPVNRARLLASTAPGSGSWLHALPCSNLGLRLGNEELRIAVGLRLGTPLVRTHVCVCGVEVEQNGHHGLACRRSAGRHRRHAFANDVIVRAIRSIDVHAELEPPRLLRGDGKRPDGATLDPWNRGQYLVWDFTCPDTLAPSHLNQSSLAAGSAAVRAEASKRAKYAALAESGDYIFSPIAVETLGSWGPSALAICAEIGGRIAARTGDPRATSFLRQRMDIAVQRGNAAAVVGTLPR